MSACGDDLSNSSGGDPGTPIEQPVTTDSSNDRSDVGDATNDSVAEPPPGGDVVADELAIMGMDEADARQAVKAEEGDVVEVDEHLGIIRARFPVTSLEELLAVRDRLRAKGLDATLIQELDPHDLGSGREDDPA